jgi:predicted transcriptional regulator
LCLQEIEAGLADVAAGRHQDARQALAQIKQRRAPSQDR